jgi:hypothetical protein
MGWHYRMSASLPMIPIPFGYWAGHVDEHLGA